MNRERLQFLIRVLRDKASAKKFDMGTWATFPAKQADAMLAATGTLRINHCGTAACALGWLASQPKANREGLKLVVCGRDNNILSASVTYRKEGWGLAEDAQAGAFYLEVSVRTAKELFLPSSYHREPITRQDVIDKAQTLLYCKDERLFLEMCSAARYGIDQYDF